MSSQQILLELINHDNDIDFTLNELDFQTPEATQEHERNTRLLIKAHKPGRYRGEVEIFYNRVDIAEAFTELGLDHPEVAPENSETLDAVLAALKSQYRLDLAVAEVADHVIDEDEVLLEIAAGSLAFTGSLVVKRITPTLDLDLAIEVDILNGFYAPGKIPPSQ